MILGEVRTFPNVRADKEQALKPLEEAAEVFSAWESWTECNGSSDQILEEIADCITACCNLAAALGCEDMRPMIECVRRKNEARGRYDGAKCGTCRHGLRSVVWCDAPTAGGCISGMRNVYEDACAEYEEAL